MFDYEILFLRGTKLTDVAASWRDPGCQSSVQSYSVFHTMLEIPLFATERQRYAKFRDHTKSVQDLWSPPIAFTMSCI